MYVKVIPFFCNESYSSGPVYLGCAYGPSSRTTAAMKIWLLLLWRVLSMAFSQSVITSFCICFRRLYLFLSMLVHGDEDGKSEESINKEKESILLINSIFQSIKRSEDSVDTTKSMVKIKFWCNFWFFYFFFLFLRLWTPPNSDNATIGTRQKYK